MQIPDKIKILGHCYDIVMIDQHETGEYGTCDFNTLKIRLNKNKALGQIYATLLHEIIEALNHDLELRLEHPQISSLEAGLYQVLKDNKLYFDTP